MTWVEISSVVDGMVMVEEIEDQVEEVAYKFGKLIGYHDGHYWRGGNALDAALGAAYGCNGEGGPARRGIARVRGYDIYRTSEGQLVAVSCLDAYQVEEVA